MPLTTLDFGALRHDCAAAVIVIGRTPERYSLQLTDEETAMLTRVTSVFDRTVLVLAAPGFIELNEAALSCGAIVFLGLAGQEAGGALADVLTAKVCRPASFLSGPSMRRRFPTPAPQQTSLRATAILIPSASPCAIRLATA